MALCSSGSCFHSVLAVVGFCVAALAESRRLFGGCNAMPPVWQLLLPPPTAPQPWSESAGGIKGPSPKKATGVGLRLVCSLTPVV